MSIYEASVRLGQDAPRRPFRPAVRHAVPRPGSRTRGADGQVLRAALDSDAPVIRTLVRAGRDRAQACPGPGAGCPNSSSRAMHSGLGVVSLWPCEGDEHRGQDRSRCLAQRACLHGSASMGWPMPARSACHVPPMLWMHRGRDQVACSLHCLAQARGPAPAATLPGFTAPAWPRTRRCRPRCRRRPRPRRAPAR